MKKAVYILLCLASLAAVALTSQDNNVIPADVITAETASYRSWQLFPGSTKLMKGKGPHGALITTYLNEKGVNAVSADSEAMPDGTIIVKENYNNSGDFHSAVVMKKVGDEWHWGILQSKEPVDAAGIGANGQNLQSCQECHRWAKRDQVFLWK